MSPRVCDRGPRVFVRHAMHYRTTLQPPIRCQACPDVRCGLLGLWSQAPVVDPWPAHALESVARGSVTVKAEFVAVWVGHLDAVSPVGKTGRTERDQSFHLAGGIRGDQVEALPVPCVLGLDRWSVR